MPQWRKILRRIVLNKLFDHAVFLLIAVNCACIAAVNFDTTVGMDDTFDMVNNILTFAFATEMTMKFLAHGAIKFFKEPWNVFDLVVVVAGLGGFIAENNHSSSSVNSPYTRTIRILRLIRVLSVSENLRILATALISSSKNLVHVIILLSFFILLVSDIALDFFKGSFQHRCYSIEYSLEIANGTQTTFVVNNEANDANVCRYSALSNEFPVIARQFFAQDTTNETEIDVLVSQITSKILYENNYDPRYNVYSLDLGFIADNVSKLPFSSTSAKDDEFMCRYGDICIISQTPQYGMTNFDSVISTTSLIYDLMSSLDGWTFIIYFLSMGKGWWIATLYFGVILTVGNFFLLNLTLVVILDAFDRSQTLTSMIEEAVLKTASDMDLAQQLQDATNNAHFVAPRAIEANQEQSKEEGEEKLLTRRERRRKQITEEEKKLSMMSRMARALGGTDEFDANDNNKVKARKSKKRKSEEDISMQPLQDNNEYEEMSSSQEAPDNITLLAEKESAMMVNMNAVYRQRIKTMRTARNFIVEGGKIGEKESGQYLDCEPVEEEREMEISFNRPATIESYSLLEDYSDAQLRRSRRAARGGALKAKNPIMCCLPCWSHIPCPRSVQRAAVLGLVTRRVIRQYIVSQTWFRVLTGSVLVINLGFESSMYAGMSEKHRDVIDDANVFFTLFYVIEVTLKIIAYPFFVFRRDFFNFFDVGVTFASTIELFISGGGETFSALRSLRLLRIISLVSSFRSTMATLLAAFRGAISLLVLLFLFMFLFAVVGMQIFSGSYCGFDSSSLYRVNTTLCDNVPRYNFDNVAYSFQTIFSIVSSEGWRDMMVVAEATTSPYTSIFFCVTHFTVGYLVLNLFVAVMLSSCSEVQIVTYALSAMLEAEQSTKGGKVKAFTVKKSDIGIDVDEERSSSKLDKNSIKADEKKSGLGKSPTIEEEVSVAAVTGSVTTVRFATSPLTASSPAMSPLEPTAVDLDERRNRRKAEEVAQHLVTDIIAQQGPKKREEVEEHIDYSEEDSEESSDDGYETPQQKLSRHRAEELRKRNEQRNALVAEFANSEAERLIERGVAAKHLPGLAHTKGETSLISNPNTQPSFKARRSQYPLFARIRLRLRELAATLYTSRLLLCLIALSTALSVVYQFIFSPLHGPYNSIRLYGYGLDIFVAIVYLLEVFVKLLYFGVTSPDRLPDSVRFSADQQLQREQVKEQRKRAMTIREQLQAAAESEASHTAPNYAPPLSHGVEGSQDENEDLNVPGIPALLGDIDELSDFVFPTSTFFEINWNIFEMIIAITAVVIVLVRGLWNHAVDADYRTSELATTCNAIIVWLRILRNLHIWSFVRYFPLANLLLRSLIRALQTLRNATAITILIWYIYSVLGLQLFGGKFNACATIDNSLASGSDNNWGDATYSFPFIDNRDECLASGYYWETKRMNFNNVFEALITTFNVATVSNWHFTMYTATDVRGTDLAPKQNSTVWAPLYFMSFIVIMSYFLINFFKSALIDSYFSTKAAIEAKFVEIREAREAAAELVKQRRTRALEAARRRLEKIKRKEERDGGVTAQSSLVSKSIKADYVDVHWDDGLVSSSEADIATMSPAERAMLRKNEQREQKKKHLLSKINSIVEQVVPTSFIAEVVSVENAKSASEIRRAVESDKNNHENFILMLTEDERYFFNLYRFALYFVRPPLVIEHIEGRGTSEIRRILRRWFRSRQCDILIFLAACAHMFVEFTQYWEPPVMSYRNFAVVDIGFTCFFILTMIGKATVYGPKAYLDRRRNQFDVLVNLLTFVGSVMALSTPDSYMWTAARVLMFFRFTRLHYILFVNRGMAVQLRMFVDSSKSFLSVFVLLFMLVFTFTAMAMNLFGRVKWTDYDGLNQWSTFSRFDRAMYTLVRIGTTDNWNHIMHNCQLEAPVCDPNIGECGNQIISPVFFIIYLSFANWIGLNFFTAVLMEGFVKTDSDEKFPIQQEDIRTFQRQWKKLSRRDPTHHTLTFNELVSFMCLLPPKPLGLGAPLKNMKGPRSEHHDGVGVRSPFSKISIADALAKSSKFLADTGIKSKYAQHIANLDTHPDTFSNDNGKPKYHQISVTRLLLNLSQVPLYHYGTPTGDAIALYGDGASTLGQYYCFPDDVFDGLTRIHYGNKLPKVAEGLLLKERFSRFRREHAEDVMERISTTSHFNVGVSPSEDSLLATADRVKRGHYSRDSEITNNFAVTNVASMTAALVIQRFWRSLRD